jgi:hypothetical protein
MTLAPNTVNKVWVIKNSTSGSQSISISQGSGSNVTIGNGATVMVYTDGAGSGAAVTQVDLLGGGGGTLTGDLDFADNVKAQFGDSQDLQIYHDGSNSYINDGGTGNLFLGGTNLYLRSATGENYLGAVQDGAVTLYYDNSTKLATTSSGVTVTGTVTADGVSLGDNEKALFGAGNDLEIFHDGSNSFIDDAGTGVLSIRSNSISLGKYTGENLATFVADGAVTLYYDNSAKFETTSYGVDISGSAVADTQTAGSITGSTTLDFDTYQNFVLTLTGNITLANPTTEKVGQSGFIAITQTGGYTVSLGTDYETAGGAGITLSASGTDLIPYIVIASGRILLGTPQLAFA